MKVLLDYDDTLAKTEKVALGAACDLTNEVLESLGCPPVDRDEFIATHPGKTFRHILAEVLAANGRSLPDEELDRLAALEVDRVLGALAKGLEAMEGAIDALKGLQEAGHELAVVSSSASRRLDACLDTTGQGEYIPRELVFSAKDSLPAPKSKPAPDVYLHAKRVIGGGEEEFIAVEDSKSGVRSAVAANIPTVGFVGSRPPEARAAAALELFDNGARWVIDDLTQLPLLVDRAAEGKFDLLDQCYGRAAWGFKPA